MTRKFSISKFTKELLQEHPEKRFTAREIAQWIVESYPEATEAKKRRSTAKKVPLVDESSMLQQIVAEIGAQRPALEQRHGIRTTTSRPRKYYYSTTTEAEEVEALTLNGSSSNAVDQKTLRETDLYEMLQEYANSELSVRAMRIDERRATNSRGKGGNHWL